MQEQEERKGTILLFAWLSHFFCDFFIGIWPVYKTMQGLNVATAGLITGVAGLIGDGVQPLFGYLSDRGHAYKLLALGLLCCATLSLLPLTQDYRLMFGLMLCLYLGSGIVHPAAGRLVGALQGDRRGLYFTIFGSGGMLGLAISQLLFVHAYRLFDGRTFYLFVPIVLFAALLFFRHSTPAQLSQIRPLPWKQFFKDIRPSLRQFIVLYFVQVCAYSLIQAYVFVLPDILRHKGAMEWLWAGGGHLFFVAGSALFMLPAGLLADAVGHKIVIQTLFLLAALSSVLLLWGPATSLVLVILYLFLIGASLYTIGPLVVSLGSRLLPAYAGVVSAVLMGMAWAVCYMAAFGVGSLTAYFGEGGHTQAVKVLFLIFGIGGVTLTHLLPLLEGEFSFRRWLTRG